jgi:hypothetical protein
MKGINWDLCPRNLRGGLERYLESGIPPGSFLTAVLTNDLREAFATADLQNRAQMYHLVNFLYNEFPGGAWGSKKKFDSWLQVFQTREEPDQPTEPDTLANLGLSEKDFR